MNNVNNEAVERLGIDFFEKYLSVWVLLCMVAGILIGTFLPGVADQLESYLALDSSPKEKNV